MEPTNQGNSGGAEQAVTGIQQIAEQSQAAQTQTAPNAGASQAQQAAPTYTPEQITEWQNAAKERDQFKKQYENILPEYTRSRQALAAFAGSDPQRQQQQNDPYSKAVEFAKSKGYDAENARVIAEMADMMAQERTGAAMKQFSYQNVGNQIPVVMQQAWQQVPTAFGNPKIQEQVQSHLYELAQQGNFDLINPAYAANFAKIAAFDAGFYTPPQQQQAQPQPFANGMFGIPPGFSQGAQQQQVKQDAPKTSEVISDLRSRYGADIK